MYKDPYYYNNEQPPTPTSRFVQIWAITLRSFSNDIAAIFSPPNASYFLAIINTTSYIIKQTSNKTHVSFFVKEERGWMIFMDAKKENQIYY